MDVVFFIFCPSSLVYEIYKLIYFLHKNRKIYTFSFSGIKQKRNKNFNVFILKI